MHLLGQSISVSVVRAGTETVLIDVPRWDFHWQGSYELQTPVLVPRLSVRDVLTVSVR